MSRVYRPWTLVDGSWPYPWPGGTNLVTDPPTAEDWQTDKGTPYFYQRHNVGTDLWQNVFCNRVSKWLVWAEPLDIFGHVDFSVGDIGIDPGSFLIPGSQVLGIRNDTLYPGWTNLTGFPMETKVGDREVYIKNEEKLPGNLISTPDLCRFQYKIQNLLQNNAHNEIIFGCTYELAIFSDAPEIWNGGCYVPCIHRYTWAWQEGDVRTYGGYVSSFQDLPSGVTITAGYDTLISRFRVSEQAYGSTDHIVPNPQLKAYEFTTMKIDGTGQTSTVNNTVTSQRSLEIYGTPTPGTVWIQPPPSANFADAPTAEPYFAYRSDNANDGTSLYDTLTGRFLNPP